MKATTRAILGAVLILIITVAAMLVFNKLVGRTRLDLTQHGIYTLSEGTKNILSELNQTVKLKLFYSRVAARKGPEGIRFYNSYYLYVRDLLEEYANLSNGKLKLELIDPRPFSDAEDEAVRYGIRRFQISDEEGFFFGLAAESELGKDSVIEFFEPDRQEFVEYDISKLITGVTMRDKKTVGVLSSLPVMGGDLSPYMMQMMQMQGRTPPQPWTIITQLRESYELRSIDSDTAEIPSDIDFLLVIHAKNLEPKTLFAIDQYVMRGGKLIVFVDPHCLSDQPPRDPQNPYASMGYSSASDLNALLENWGVKMETGLIAADRNLAIKAALYRGQPAVPFITYLGLTNDNVNHEEVISAELHNIRMLYAGVLTKVEKKQEKTEGETEGTAKKTGEDQVTITPLLTTTKLGNTWKPSGSFELQMPNPDAMSRAVPDGDKELMLACRISGRLTTNFPDGLPKGAPEEDESEEAGDSRNAGDAASEPLRVASPEAAVVVVADVDVISDVLAYEQTFFGMAQAGDNASLLLNTLDYLGGSRELIAIRSRGRFQRPFTLVDEIEKKAEEATAAEVEATNAKIEQYQKRLNDLGESADEKNVRLVESEALAERHKLEGEIREARKELRRLNAGKLEAIESLGSTLQTVNMVFAPAVVLLIAVVIAVFRFLKARAYATRRID
jgi:ABC-2 type transport system permease protein